MWRRGAKKLQAARTDEHCRLILVGKVSPSLDGIESIGLVDIEAKNLNLTDLLEQAAHRLAKFLEAEGMHTGTGLQREMIVHALVSQLEHLSTRSEALTRETFIKTLRQWIDSAPKGNEKIDLSHFDVMNYAPTRLIGRETQEKLLNDTWLQVVRGENKRPNVHTFVA